ncbi:uncharacterized protein TNCV_696471 [Trichonephila clavipes]|nr:uncharacterized protein TNCV_696471 [Trichonephila clavipes]
MGVQKLYWPSQSPDLNPIEHLWDELERRLRSQPNRPPSLQALTSAVMDAWKAISTVTYQKLVESLPKPPVRYIPLQLRHRRERLRWCKDHVGWDHQNWSRVMFGESRFRATSDSGHQLLWRELKNGTLEIRYEFPNSGRAKRCIKIKSAFHLVRVIMYVSQPKSSCDKGDIPDNLMNLEQWSHFHINRPLHPHNIASLCTLFPGGIEKLLWEQVGHKNVSSWE